MRSFVVSMLLVPLSLFAQNKTAISRDDLKQEIEKLKGDPDLKYATWGLCVISVKSGEVIAEHNSDASLIPASTLKILTTGAALGLLDTSYKYETRLEHDGFIDSVGVLHGNLYIKGFGDPTLESDYFKSRNGILDRWSDVIKQKGIKSIEGSITADASLFDDELIPPSWIWGDIGNYYGSGASGLNFLDNKYTIYFKSGLKNGDSTKILKVSPEVPSLHLTNYVTTGGSDDNAFVYGSQNTYDRYIKGTIPARKTNYEVEGSMPYPALFCAYSLEQKLKAAGINVFRPASLYNGSGANGKNRIPIDTFYSPGIDSIVYYTNLKSNNLYAESLLKTIAAKQTGSGSSAAGIEEVKKYWTSKGIDLKGLYMTDGCGLSRGNSLTARQQAEILKTISGESYFKAFYNSLPVAGKSGSLAGMCKGTCAEDNLRAKSGYINRVRGYAGYVKNLSGDELAFSILVNNYDCSPSEVKKKIEHLLVLISRL